MRFAGIYRSIGFALVEELRRGCGTTKQKVWPSQVGEDARKGDGWAGMGVRMNSASVRFLECTDVV